MAKKQIIGFPGYYATKTGEIWSSPRKGVSMWRLLKPRLCNKGYPRVTLRVDKKLKSPHVHRLVLLAFVGPCPKGMEGCHNDGDSKNYCLKNLRWDTRSNNMKDKFIHKTQSHKGEKNSRAKLNKKQVSIIRYLAPFKEFTYKELGHIFNVGPACISKVINKTRWNYI